MRKSLVVLGMVVLSRLLAGGSLPEPIYWSELMTEDTVRPVGNGNWVIEKGVVFQTEAGPKSANAGLFIPDVWPGELTVVTEMELVKVPDGIPFQVGVTFFADGSPHDWIKPACYFSSQDSNFHVSSRPFNTHATSPFKLEAGKKVMLKARVVPGREMMAKAWLAGAPEPEDWTVRQRLLPMEIPFGNGLILDAMGASVKFSRFAVYPAAATAEESFKWQVVVDDTGPGCILKGNWRVAEQALCIGGSCHWTQPGDVGAVWTAEVKSAGSAVVWIHMTDDPAQDHATNATYHVKGPGVDLIKTVDLRRIQAFQWIPLGQVRISQPGAITVTLSGSADGNLVADAVRVTSEE